MSEGIRQAITELEEERKRQLAEVGNTEQLINRLLTRIGEAPRYSDSASQDAGGTVRRGQFYDKPLATAVREYLLTRNRTPATTEEIMAGLDAGEFDFKAMGWKAETRSRSLAMSLAKNTQTFHRLPSGSFGLIEWYPNVAAKRAERKASG